MHGCGHAVCISALLAQRAHFASAMTVPLDYVDCRDGRHKKWTNRPLQVKVRLAQACHNAVLKIADLICSLQLIMVTDGR